MTWVSARQTEKDLLYMEKVRFQSPGDGETLEFYVIEQTRINGVNYLLVAEEEEVEIGRAHV